MKNNLGLQMNFDFNFFKKDKKNYSKKDKEEYIKKLEQHLENAKKDIDNLLKKLKDLQERKIELNFGEIQILNKINDLSICQNNLYILEIANNKNSEIYENKDFKNLILKNIIKKEEKIDIILEKDSIYMFIEIKIDKIPSVKEYLFKDLGELELKILKHSLNSYIKNGNIFFEPTPDSGIIDDDHIHLIIEDKNNYLYKKAIFKLKNEFCNFASDITGMGYHYEYFFKLDEYQYNYLEKL